MARRRRVTPTPASRSSRPRRCPEWTQRMWHSDWRTAGADRMTTTETPAEPAAPPGAAGVLRQSVNLATLGPLVALVLAVLFFSLRTDRFLTGSNLSLI